MACNCCEQPPCPPPSIQSKGISATGSKTPPPTPCGYAYDGRYWAKRIDTASGTETCTGCFGPGSDYTATRSVIVTTTRTLIEGVCTESAPVYEGSSTYSYTYSDGSSAGCETILAADGSWSGSIWETSSSGETTSWPYNAPCAGFFIPTVTTYSDEVTPEPGESTAEMIARVTDELPPYPDDWSYGSGAASRNLSPDESSFSLSRFKWRLRHQPTGTCYLRVWLRKVEYPEGAEEPIYTDLPPYTWSGSGNPCLPSPENSPGHDDNAITGSEAEISDPAEDGSISIEIVKWSCLPGYVPPDDGSANGYPIAEEVPWE